jgi:hypothetical protein
MTPGSKLPFFNGVHVAKIFLQSTPSEVTWVAAAIWGEEALHRSLRGLCGAWTRGEELQVQGGHGLMVLLSLCRGF